MAKQDGDRLVKILLTTGIAVHMYADMTALSKVLSNPKFVRFKDDSNDNVLLSLDHICGFEIMDERRGGGPLNAEQVNPISETE